MRKIKCFEWKRSNEEIDSKGEVSSSSKFMLNIIGKVEQILLLNKLREHIVQL